MNHLIMGDILCILAFLFGIRIGGHSYTLEGDQYASFRDGRRVKREIYAVSLTFHHFAETRR